MKWLFAILVVLNLIIFGNVVTQKMQAPPPAPPVASQPASTMAAPPTAHIAEQSASAAEAEADAAASAATSMPVVTKTESHKKNKPATPAATTAPAGTEGVVVSGHPQGGACSATVTLSEDVYHRIKGLLNRWPNAASRVVVNNQTAATTDAGKQYQVLVPVTGDSNEQVISLLAKGFKPTPSGNSISLGVYQNRLHAEQLRDRLSAAGYSAGIVERSSGGGSTQALTSAKYQVLFMQISDQDAKELSAIVRPYAPLQRKPCGKK